MARIMIIAPAGFPVRIAPIRLPLGRLAMMSPGLARGLVLQGFRVRSAAGVVPPAAFGLVWAA
jgi:hypothetical protein